MTTKRLTPKQQDALNKAVARWCIGKKTINRGATIEYAWVDQFSPKVITVRFEGWGLAPFREARYTAKEIQEMVGETFYGYDTRIY